MISVFWSLKNLLATFEFRYDSYNLATTFVYNISTIKDYYKFVGV